MKPTNMLALEVKVEPDLCEPDTISTIRFTICGERIVDGAPVQTGMRCELEDLTATVRTYRKGASDSRSSVYLGESFRELVAVDLRELETRVKALRSVTRKIRKLIERERPESAAQLVSIFARAVKANAVWREIGRKPNNRRIMERHVDIYGFATSVIREHTEVREEAVA